MLFLVLLALLASIAIVASVVQVSRDGYRAVATRPGTPPAEQASRHVGGGR
ncbi:hypothetical protein [Subtercola boreus]|uniref:hypothetical protein n=1 Tax=Subtercola boreus TaxID=120213 RepID=UPI00116A678F|nr:hypothetical protein [Subtercola boreus]TQL54001.1 hypothetical protein FB464_1527 [Subtercola boreus]